MNLEPYQEFVVLKAAPPRELTVQEFNLNHACLGLATEYLELKLAEDQANYREEMEDLAWYLMLLATTLQINLSLLPDRSNEDEVLDLLDIEDDIDQSLETMLSLAKKTIMYGKPKFSEMRIAFFPLWRAYLDLLEEEEYPLDHVIQNNMTKLNQRYLTSFSQEESEARKDKQ